MMTVIEECRTTREIGIEPDVCGHDEGEVLQVANLPAERTLGHSDE